MSRIVFCKWMMDEHGWKEKTLILDGWLANDAKIWNNCSS
jgi:hypothetical protein